MSRGRWVLLAIAVGAAAVVVVAAWPKPMEVDTGRVARGPLEETIAAEGQTRVRQRYSIVAPVAGRVERITRVEGAAVHAGDTLARLLPLPLDSQTVIAARARVDAAVAVTVQAAEQTRSAEAALGQRRREVERAKRLAEVGGVAPRAVEESELAATEAEASARIARQQTLAADAELREARAALIGVTRGAQAAIAVRAPANGRVLRVPERSERVVAAGAPLIEIGDASSLEIVVDVLSSDGSRIHPGDAVRISGWGPDQPEDPAPTIGRVREVEPSAFTKVSALGVDEQRVNVIIDAASVPAGVGDGFRVEVSIIVWNAPSVVAMPRSALVQVPGDSSNWSAYVVRSGRVVRRTVRVGHVGALQAEVLEGPDPGEEVVLFPSDLVVPGARVRPRAAPPTR